MDDEAYPEVVSRERWLAERKALLVREKEATRLRDEVNAARRRLPMVEVEKSYLFDGPGGKLRLSEMFEGRRLLYVHHFMWVDATDRGCPSCSIAADLTFTEGDRAMLTERGVTFACISRAPYAKLARYKAERGWSFPWYSSHGSDFHYDFQTTLQRERAPIVYNFRTHEELLEAGIPDALLRGDFPGASVFMRRGERVFHTYSAYARGLDHLAPGYGMLDLTPYGRQEDWEDSPAGFPQRPTYG
jgi:predicted dithiol-disulfide oxidoreductase (DUF899 family)